MGNPALLEYESLEKDALLGETEAANFKHNGGVGLGTENPPFGRQTKSPEATETAATMPNDLLIPPDTESQAAAPSVGGVELDLSFGVPVEQKSIFVDLFENLRDVFFPVKLPPLELTSTPIPVPDRMAVKRNPVAVGVSAVINGLLVALMLLIGVKTIIEKAKTPVVLTPIDVTDYKTPKPVITAGGGGGSPDQSEASLGRIPPRVKAVADTPKLAPPTPTVDVQPDITLPDNPLLPNFGMSHSPNVKLASTGNGTGTGLGSGHGTGYGTGTGGNTGGGVYRVGGDISIPKAFYAPDPEFSDEARRAKYQGEVTIQLIVDAQGNPQNPRVVQALGMGLDEKAIEAVMRYKFKPALKGGKTPVPVIMNIVVNFRMF
jgi:protein TonB